MQINIRYKEAMIGNCFLLPKDLAIKPGHAKYIYCFATLLGGQFFAHLGGGPWFTRTRRVYISIAWGHNYPGEEEGCSFL